VTKQFRSPMIVSAETLSRLADLEEYSIRSLGALAVIGKHQGIAVHEIFDADEPDLVAHKLATRDAFGRALDAYRAGNFAEALVEFEAISAAHPGDGPAAYYRERCSELAARALDTAWDGIERLLVK
jgi:hypothetical protein